MADHRNPMIAKIHIAKKDLALTDDSYRDLLRRVTGQESAARCDDQQLSRVLIEFKRLGWKPAGEKTYSQHGHVRKIHALWASMAHLLENPSDAALRAFCQRQTGLSAPAFLTPGQANKVIEGLKAWKARLERERAA